jgi:hypothetical protein
LMVMKVLVLDVVVSFGAHMGRAHAVGLCPILLVCLKTLCGVAACSVH